MWFQRFTSHHIFDNFCKSKSESCCARQPCTDIFNLHQYWAATAVNLEASKAEAAKVEAKIQDYKQN